MSSKIGIKCDALNWFRSYLSDCTQAVYINGAISDCHDVVCGVLQGSVLVSLLYLIYTSPIGDILRSHRMKVHLYADDTQYNNYQHYYHLRNIARARRYLSFHTTDILVHAFVTMKLGNENTLLYGLPKDQIRNVSTCS